MKKFFVTQYCLKQFLYGIILLTVSTVNAAASEEKIMNLIRYHIENMEYYNAITETMRYQYMFPEGKYYPESLVLQGKAYYHGGNNLMAVKSLETCFSLYKDTPEGDRSLFYTGYIRLTSGSPYYSYRTFQQYLYLYPKGIFTEEARVDICHSLALMHDLEDSKEKISLYRKEFPDGKYLQDIKHLETLILREEERPRKSMWISVLGSVFVPGFGHFYTERYDVGFFTFFTNAALIFLFYDGYRDNDKLRMAIFGIAELSFYQHSLFSAVNNVYRYNSSEEFYRDVQLGISKRF